MGTERPEFLRQKTKSRRVPARLKAPETLLNKISEKAEQLMPGGQPESSISIATNVHG